MRWHWLLEKVGCGTVSSRTPLLSVYEFDSKEGTALENGSRESWGSSRLHSHSDLARKDFD